MDWIQSATENLFWLLAFLAMIVVWILVILAVLFETAGFISEQIEEHQKGMEDLLDDDNS